MEKQRIKHSLQIALKSERERISQDLHDELGAGLTSIRLLAKTVLAGEHLQGKLKESILKNMSKISGEMIDQMSEIIWVLNNTDGSFSNLLAYIRYYMSDFILRTQVPLVFTLQNDVTHDFQLTNLQRRNLLLVIKEAFNNVVKHSEANSIKIECTEAGANVLIVIKDNGIGLPEKISSRGNGLNNMKKRILVIGGKLTFYNDEGASLIIEVPKKCKSIL
jgi:signal transduction histidine kinase